MGRYLANRTSVPRHVPRTVLHAFTPAAVRTVCTVIFGAVAARFTLLLVLRALPVGAPHRTRVWAFACDWGAQNLGAYGHASAQSKAILLSPVALPTFRLGRVVAVKQPLLAPQLVLLSARARHKTAALAPALPQPLAAVVLDLLSLIQHLALPTGLRAILRPASTCRQGLPETGMPSEANGLTWHRNWIVRRRRARGASGASTTDRAPTRLLSVHADDRAQSSPSCTLCTVHRAP